MKAKARIIVVAMLCIACLGALVGCSGNTAEQDAQTQNRQYMSSVNTIMDTLNTNMEEFATAVKDGEVVSLDAQLEAVNTCVDDLNAITPPEAMTDIHKSYVTGATEMQTALAAYVQLYEDVNAPQSGSFDYSTYDSRLADIQSHYDAGIAAFQDADSKKSHTAITR